MKQCPFLKEDCKKEECQLWSGKNCAIVEMVSAIKNLSQVISSQDRKSSYS